MVVKATAVLKDEYNSMAAPHLGKERKEHLKNESAH